MSTFNVKLPDGETCTLPGNLEDFSDDDVRDALSIMTPIVDTAEVTRDYSTNTVTFSRPQGGSKA